VYLCFLLCICVFYCVFVVFIVYLCFLLCICVFYCVFVFFIVYLCFLLCICVFYSVDRSRTHVLQFSVVNKSGSKNILVEVVLWFRYK